MSRRQPLTLPCATAACAIIADLMIPEPTQDLTALKPFRSAGLVRRVTPFIATGLIALVLLVDPHLQNYATDALAFVAAIDALILSLSHPRRATVLTLLSLSLLFALAPTWVRPQALAASLFCVAIVASVYLLPWDAIPRPFHAAVSPVGVLAVLTLQMIFGSSSMLIFPLLVIVVLFAALHYSRGELLVAVSFATVATLFRPLALHSLSSLATSFLLSTVLWVLTLAVHDLVSQLAASRTTISRLLGPDYKTLFESVPSAYLVLDSSLRITAVSDAYLQATMTSRPSLLGRGIFEAFPDDPKDPAADGVRNLRASLERVLTSRESDTMPIQHYPIRRPDGSFEDRWWSPRNVPVLDSGHRLVAIIHRVADVSEFVLSHQAQAAAEERVSSLEAASTEIQVELFQRSRELAQVNADLQAASKARNLFVASLSHELRTPLTSVLGFTDALLSRLPGPLTDEQSRQLTTMRASAAHLLAVINDFLDLARIEQGRWQPAYEPILLSDFADSLLASLQPQAQAKGLALSSSVPAALAYTSDRKALSQILLNLLSNAIKATSKGEVRLGVHHDDSNLYFAISDTGLGIAPESQARLFAAFERPHVPPSLNPEGSGLGLYFSQRLAHLLGGAITFISSPHAGSTFTLSLPWPSPQPLPAAAQ